MITNPIGYPIANPIRFVSPSVSDFDPIGIPRPVPTRPEPHKDLRFAPILAASPLRSDASKSLPDSRCGHPTDLSLLGNHRPRARFGGAA